MDCEYCNNGEIKVLINYAGYYYNGEEPIIEIEPCEYCIGTDLQPSEPEN